MDYTPEQITELRAAVVAEVRKWVGTPYRHCAQVLGAGVDCGMLLAAVYPAVMPERFSGLVVPEYSPQWHLHHSEERYLNLVKQYAVEVDYPLPGDIVCVKFGRAFAHGGIVSNWSNVIHAYMQGGCVIEEDFMHNKELSGRPFRFFSPWGADEPSAKETI